MRLLLAVFLLSVSLHAHAFDLDVGVAGDGLILDSKVSSCVDRAEKSRTRSVDRLALIFPNFSLTWRGLDKSLFVGAIRVDVFSPALVGGEQSFVLASDEVDALLGRPGSLIEIPPGETSVTVNSNSTSRPGEYPACQLAVGGLQVLPGTQSFIANVTIKVLGSAENKITGDVEQVSYTFTAIARH